MTKCLEFTISFLILKLKLNQMTEASETSDDEQDKMWLRVFTACHSLSIPYTTAQHSTA